MKTTTSLNKEAIKAERLCVLLAVINESIGDWNNSDIQTLTGLAVDLSGEIFELLAEGADSDDKPN